MGHQRKLGSYGKNRIFGPKTEILGPKKGDHFLILTMFWPRPEKVVPRKKVPLPKFFFIFIATPAGTQKYSLTRNNLK